MKKIFYVVLLVIFFIAGFVVSGFLKNDSSKGAVKGSEEAHEEKGHGEGGHEEGGHEEGEEAGHDEGKNTVTLSQASQDAAGFKYETAKSTAFSEVIHAIGQINSDAEVSAHVLPEESGVVEECGILPGVKVEKGSQLCVITGKNGQMSVKSPISGTVLSSNSFVNMKVDKITSLHTIADMSKLNAVFNLNENDIYNIRIGQRVRVKYYDQHSGQFDGRVTYISPSVDAETRTVKVGVSVNNIQERLKLGMFVKAEFEVEKQGSYIVVPRDAAQYSGGKKIAFVKTGNDKFEMRELVIAGERPDFIAVTSGIKEKELVVAGGGFLLKSEFFKSKMGAGCAD